MEFQQLDHIHVDQIQQNYTPIRLGLDERHREDRNATSTCNTTPIRVCSSDEEVQARPVHSHIRLEKLNRYADGYDEYGEWGSKCAIADKCYDEENTVNSRLYESVSCGKP